MRPGRGAKKDWRTYRLAWVGRRIGRPDLPSFSDLNKDQARAALEALETELPAGDLRRSRRRGGPASGIAGRKNRQGDPQVLVGAASLELLGALKAHLGWNQQRFEAFARRQLRGRATISTEADANKVIWPMKALIRRGSASRAEQRERGSSLQDSETNGASHINQTPESGSTAQAEKSSVESSPVDGAGISACSGCPGLVDGDPHGRGEDSDFAPSTEGEKQEGARP